MSRYWVCRGQTPAVCHLGGGPRHYRNWLRAETRLCEARPGCEPGVRQCRLITEPFLTLFARSVNVFSPAKAVALRLWLSWKVGSDSHPSTSKPRLTAASFLPGQQSLGVTQGELGAMQRCHSGEIAFHISSGLLYFWRRINSFHSMNLWSFTLYFQWRWITVIGIMMYLAHLLSASHPLDV